MVRQNFVPLFDQKTLVRSQEFASSLDSSEKTVPRIYYSQRPSNQIIEKPHSNSQYNVMVTTPQRRSVYNP